MAKRNVKIMIGTLGGAAALLGIAVIVSFYLAKPRRLPPPSLPDDPVAATAQPPAEPRCGPLHYGSLLKSAATKYKVPAPTIEQMAQPLNASTEFIGAHLLMPKGKKSVLVTDHLRLALEVERLQSSGDGTQGINAEHLVLSITNKSDVPVAYRVLTRIGQEGAVQCNTKADLPYNALALRPRETVRRTECFANGRRSLAVLRVDVVELSPLGYHWVSRLDPVEGGPFDMRVARGHNRAGLSPCRSLPWRDLDLNTDIWQVVIDFHARHDCDEYSLPRSYRPFSAPGVLPVCK